MNDINHGEWVGTIQADAASVPMPPPDKTPMTAANLIWKKKMASGAEAGHIFPLVGTGDVAAPMLAKMKQFTRVLIVGRLTALNGAPLKIFVESFIVVD